MEVEQPVLNTQLQIYVVRTFATHCGFNLNVLSSAFTELSTFSLSSSAFTKFQHTIYASVIIQITTM